MSTELHQQLIRLANDYGADPSYARAGGGNASVKHDGVLYIKPSGTTLATLRDEDLVPLRVDVLLEALRSDEPVAGDPVMAAAEAALVGTTGGRRPSVEILFHALIPHALVLHLHPIVANAVTCNERGRELTSTLLGDEAVWVDYTDPGVPLARAIEAERVAFHDRTGREAPAITMMGNHGIIVSGDTYDEVAERLDWLSSTVQAAIDEGEAPQHAEERPAVDAQATAEAFRSATGAAAVAYRDGEAVRKVATPASAPVTRGPLIPDQIVYSGSMPLVITNPGAIGDTVAEFVGTHGRTPITAVIPGALVLAVGETKRTADVALETFIDALQIAFGAERLGTTRVMDERERHFIENWEAESYRKKVAAES